MHKENQTYITSPFSFLFTKILAYTLQDLGQGPKLTFLPVGRCQLATGIFFSVAIWKNVATGCEILVASAKFLVTLVTRKAQFRTLRVRFTHKKTVLVLLQQELPYGFSLLFFYSSG